MSVPSERRTCLAVTRDDECGSSLAMLFAHLCRQRFNDVSVAIFLKCFLIATTSNNGIFIERRWWCIGG